MFLRPVIRNRYHLRFIKLVPCSLNAIFRFLLLVVAYHILLHYVILIQITCLLFLPNNKLLLLKLYISNKLIACLIFVIIFVVCFFFSKLTFLKYSFRNTISVSNSLDPDRAKHVVRPDFGSNCLRMLSADDKGVSGR